MPTPGGYCSRMTVLMQHCIAPHSLWLSGCQSSRQHAVTQQFRSCARTWYTAGSGNELTNSGGLNSNRSGGNSDVSRPMPVSLLHHHLEKRHRRIQGSLVCAASISANQARVICVPAWL